MGSSPHAAIVAPPGRQYAPKRPNGTGSIRQRGPWRWEGRYTDALGIRRYVYAGSRGEVEARLTACTGLVLREAPALLDWAGLKHPRQPKPPVAHVYTRTALVQLVAAVRDVLTGAAPLSELELPLHAAEGVLAEEGGAGDPAA
jgi:hypothetical protein